MTHATTPTGPFYHGTRAHLAPGDLLALGFASNYADRKLSWIYFSGTLDAATWGASWPGERAASASTSSSRPAPSRTIPTSPTSGFPATRPQSYRLREPLRIVGEVESWQPHPPERLKEMKAALAQMDAEGGPEIID